MKKIANQIAGAALEEAVLAMLGASGFLALKDTSGDPTINPHKPAVTIRGRGAEHQIDAVADPIIDYAFSSPARLLIEAKAYREDRTVPLNVVRNAVGTIKDLSEFWGQSGPDDSETRRYHYRYAIFSTSKFSKPAQEYAFAQDVYLLPLRRSAFFLPVVESLDGIKTYFADDSNALGISITELRKELRKSIKDGLMANPLPGFEELVNAVRAVRHGLIAISNRQFPIFLVPENPEVLRNLNATERVKIVWDDNGWYLYRRDTNECLFSFDLPSELFQLYSTNGRLERWAALLLKSERLGVLRATHFDGNNVKLVTFKLDQNWLHSLMEMTPNE
ncbi:MAG: restriction endonuclease [Planctomycetes bacterium]|nr:restriction endonuclease [Planctomycetota bacterium]